MQAPCDTGEEQMSPSWWEVSAGKGSPSLQARVLFERVEGVSADVASFDS